MATEPKPRPLAATWGAFATEGAMSLSVPDPFIRELAVRRMMLLAFKTALLTQMSAAGVNCLCGQCKVNQKEDS